MLDCLNDQVSLSRKPEESKAENSIQRYKYNKIEPNIFRLEKHPLYDPVLAI